MPLLNQADNLYVGGSQASRLYRGSTMVWQDAATPGDQPPEFVAATWDEKTPGGNPVEVAAPTGVQALDYQLVAVYLVSDSVNFPAVTGWTLFFNQAVDYADGTTSTGRLGLYEIDVNHASHSTLFDDMFSFTQVGGARVAKIARVAYRNATRDSATPAWVFTPASTTHAVPLTDVPQGNAVVLGIGASEKGSGGSTFGFTSVGTAIQRVMRTAVNTSESSTIAIGEILVTNPTNDVTANYTLSVSQRAVMVPVVLNGTGSSTPSTPGSVFDLSNWKLTLPTGSVGDPTDIGQPALATYTDDNFKLNELDQMLMIAPVQGVTTSGSEQTRCEFREMQNGLEASWTPNDPGVRQLTVTMQVDPTASTDRNESIVMQIHAGENPALYLAAEWESGGNPVTPRIRIFKDNSQGGTTGFANMLAGITTTTTITLRFRCDNGTVSVYGGTGGPEALPATPNASWTAAEFFDLTGWYFKFGAYNKSTVASGGTGDVRTTISFVELIQP